MARLTEVATARLVRPLHTPFVTALRRTNDVLSVVVRLTDSDGVCGYGEAPQIWRVTGESLPGIEACILGPLAEALIGLDLDDDAGAGAQQRLGVAVAGNTGARAACEIAVHDLLARRAGVSLAAWLGSSATSVASDVTIAAQVDSAAADQIPDGFTVAKVKVGLDPDDVTRVIRIQEHAGEGVRLRVDVNQAWDVATTVANVEAWQAAGVALDFIEQPLPAWDLAGHAELRRRISLPVMLDESVFSVHDLDRAIAAESLDLVNIKLAKCGGLQAALTIAKVARQADLPVMIGSMMESELGLSAAAALAAIIAPDQTHDLDAAWWSIDPLHDHETPYAQGRFQLRQEPGAATAFSRISTDLAPWLSHTG